MESWRSYISNNVREARQDNIYSGHFPPGGKFLSTVKNGEEFKGGIEKRKEKGGKRRNKEMSDKTHVKIHL